MDNASISIYINYNIFITLRIDSYLFLCLLHLVSKLSRIRNAMPLSWPDKMQACRVRCIQILLPVQSSKPICRGV